jgi:hypothetical protein
MRNRSQKCGKETDKNTRTTFREESPVVGTGRSSTMLRKTVSTDGRVSVPADIVDTLKDAPIRTGANTVLDDEDLP